MWVRWGNQRKLSSLQQQFCTNCQRSIDGERGRNMSLFKWKNVLDRHHRYSSLHLHAEHSWMPQLSSSMLCSSCWRFFCCVTEVNGYTKKKVLDYTRHWNLMFHSNGRAPVDDVEVNGHWLKVRTKRTHLLIFAESYLINCWWEHGEIC